MNDNAVLSIMTMTEACFLVFVGVSGAAECVCVLAALVE